MSSEAINEAIKNISQLKENIERMSNIPMFDVNGLAVRCYWPDLIFLIDKSIETLVKRVP